MCLFLELQRDTLCKSNVFGYICVSDAISAQGYSFLLWWFIKRMSQVTKWLRQLLATLMVAVFISLEWCMKK